MPIISKAGQLIWLMLMATCSYAHSLEIVAEGKFIKSSNGAKLKIDADDFFILTPQSIESAQGQYVVVITQNISNRNPLGYCGAGHETTLTLYNVRKTKFQRSDSILVESCLKDILLTEDYKRIRDRHSITLAGKKIKIHWEQQDEDIDLIEIYSFENGKFSPVGKALPD